MREGWVSPRKVEKFGAGKKETREIEKWDPPPPPSQGLGNITSSTILSCTVICSRQNPRLYCTVLCYAQYSSVLYSTGLNCKATFVFPFRDSRKMPLSRLPREIDIFSCQRRRRESNNQRWIVSFLVAPPKLIYHQKKDCWHFEPI